MAKNKFFKRLLSGFLSAACVLSGTAFAGTALLDQSNVTADAATTTNDKAPFTWDNATVYFLLTDRFKNGDTSNDNAYGRQDINVGDQRATFHGGDFKGITEKINDGYFDDLGVNAIWLSAPYEQIHGYIVGGDTFYHYSYHGYYVLDYTEPDKAFGTKEEFQTLVDTAHEHGIRIVMDIVMNHAGYNSMYDMNEYNYGTLKSGWEDFYYSPNTSSTSGYHNYIDYDTSASDWGRWWGNDWVRSGLAGYTGGGGSAETQSLAGLPDFRTEQTKNVSVPQFLQSKWEKEGTLSTKNAKYGTSDTVTGFISSWLADWVRTYGIDGFRCDTAKHVEKASWNVLKTKCVAALKEWKAANPTKKLDDLDFWMTGEHWDHGCYKDDYYTTGGFDSMINFETTGGGMVSQSMVANTYKNYAASINSDPSFNVLSYVSSHDATLARPSDMYALGSAFLLLPGAVQIYYGDETARPYVSGIPQDGNGGAGHSLRSDMPWDSLNSDLVSHWGTVGRFRNSHIAVGGGSNVQLTASSGIAFGRTYDKNDITDNVAGVIYASANTQVSVDVSAIWPNGTQLHNFYDDSFATVSGGKVTFNSGAHGTILIEEPSGPRGFVKVTHINKDSGETLKTETLSGGIGESYQTSPLTLEGFTVVSTTGATSGTYSETEVNVTYYYTFDSANYGFVVTKYVDASTNAEIADSESVTKRIGTSYTTTAASIKNYELDAVPSNATGTVSSGTTTVTYKYNYVEPTNLIVHYNNPSGWSAVSLYAYDESTGTDQKFTGAWPGKAMTKGSDGWWTYEVDGVEAATIIFNNNGAGEQEPSGAGTPGYDASGEVWVKGGKVYPTGKVNVRYVDTTGNVLASEVLKGMADGTNTYTTSAKTFTGYTLSSTPANASGVYTEGTTIVNYVYASNSVAEIVNNSTITKTSFKVGESTKVTGAATGGSGSISYTFYYRRSTASNWTKFGNASSATLAPSSAGTFVIRARATDSAGNSKDKDFNVTVTSASALTNNTTVSKTSFAVGETVTVTGAAAGGNGSYSYEFYYKRSSASNWTRFGSGNKASFKPSSAGTFNLRTYAKDSTGASAVKNFTLTATSGAFVNNTTVSKTSFSVGETITITGAAAGGNGSYSYEFYYKRTTASNWTRFGSGNKASFKPSSAGTFDIRTYAKDSAGRTAVKNFTVSASKTGGALVNNTTVSATTFKVGTKVTITGAATGGSGGYYYEFYYKRSTASNWNRFGSDSTATFQPSSAGTFNILTYARDSAGNVAFKEFTLKAS